MPLWRSGQNLSPDCVSAKAIKKVLDTSVGSIIVRASFQHAPGFSLARTLTAFQHSSSSLLTYVNKEDDMAYRVTFHGVKPDTIDALRSRLQAFGFGGTDGAEGVGSSPEADVAFKYVEDA